MTGGGEAERGGPAGNEAPLGALWDFSDPAGSEVRFRAEAERARAAGAEGRALEAETQAARALGLRDRRDEAHALLDAVEARLAGAPPVVRVRYLLERGRAFNSGGRKAEAVPLFVEAYGLAGEAGLEALRLDAAHMVAIAAEPAEALEWAYRAMEVAEGSDDPRLRGWLGPLYNNTGWTHYEAGEHGKAVDLWRKGVAFREAAGAPEPLRIAWRTLATGLRALGRVEEAAGILGRIHAEDPEANEADGFWQEEMAECLALLGRGEEARPHFARAWSLLRGEDWLREQEPERYERLRREGGGE